MAKRIAPNHLFSVWSADEVAECLDGVPDDIYGFIWAEIVPLYPKKPRSECNDDFEDRCLKKFWRFVPDNFKVKLNELAVAKKIEEDREYAEFKAKKGW